MVQNPYKFEVLVMYNMAISQSFEFEGNNTVTCNTYIHTLILLESIKQLLKPTLPFFYPEILDTES